MECVRQLPKVNAETREIYVSSGMCSVVQCCGDMEECYKYRTIINTNKWSTPYGQTGMAICRGKTFRINMYTGNAVFIENMKYGTIMKCTFQSEKMTTL